MGALRSVRQMTVEVWRPPASEARMGPMCAGPRCRRRGRWTSTPTPPAGCGSCAIASGWTRSGAGHGPR
jgi:hypothetical protein